MPRRLETSRRDVTEDVDAARESARADVDLRAVGDAFDALLAVADRELAAPGPWRERYAAMIHAQLQWLADDEEVRQALMAALRQPDRSVDALADRAMRRWAVLLRVAYGSDRQPPLQFELLCGAIVNALRIRLPEDGGLDPAALAPRLIAIVDAFEPPAGPPRG